MSSSPKKGGKDALKNKFTAPLSVPRRVQINSPAEMPANYGTTPGGTAFSTTPGGTRIIYERQYILNLRNSPLACTPPKNLNYIEGITKAEALDGITTSAVKGIATQIIAEDVGKGQMRGDDEQFKMDL